MLWGSNARAAHPIFFHHLLKGIDNGAVMYAVDPRQTDPKDYDKCHFSSGYFSQGFEYAQSKHGNQTISVKTGVSWNQIYDYGWKGRQPKYPARLPT